jgi:hypothetical protein
MADDRYIPFNAYFYNVIAAVQHLSPDIKKARQALLINGSESALNACGYWRANFNSVTTM